MAQDTPDFDLEDPAVEALDAHLYGSKPDLKLIAPWTRRARRRDVPFFLSEFGAWTGRNIFTHPNPTGDTVASYDAQLINAHRVIGGLNLGVDGFNRWSFVNRGDLDGQFQLVHTFDPVRWEYLPRATPAVIPYYCYGILSRFMPKHARVLRVRGAAAGIVAAAVRSDADDISVFLLNRSRQAVTLTVHLADCPTPRRLKRHQVTQRELAQPKFTLRAIAPAQDAREPIRLRLPARSITTLGSQVL